MRIIRRCGLFVLSFALLLTTSSIVFSDSASAAGLTTIDSCVIPLEKYSEFGQALARAYKIDNINDVAFVGVCNPSQYSSFPYSSAIIAGNKSGSRFYLNSKGEPQVYIAPMVKPSDGGSYTLQGSFPSNSPSSSLFYSNGSGITLSLKNSNFSSGVFQVHSHHNIAIDPAFGSSFALPVEKLKYWPRAIFNVNDKKLKGFWCLDKGNSDCKLPPKTPVIISWQLKAPDGKVLKEDSGGQFSGAEIFQYEFDTYSTYTLEGVFKVAPSSPPMLPNVQDPAEDFVTVKIPLKIDGSSYASSTSKQKCGNDGTCEEPSVFKDCSVYNGDIAKISEAFGCHFYNFGVSFQSFLRDMFIPDGYVISSKFASMIETIKHSMGLLWTPIDFFLKIVQLGLDQQTNPVGDDCNIGSLPMFGVTAPIKLCAWRYQFPAYFEILRLAINGGIALGFSFALWLLANDILSIHIPDYEDVEPSEDDYSDAIWIDERTGETGSIHDGSIYRRGSSR